MICDYGCGQLGKFKQTTGKNCCSKYYASCPAVIEKCRTGMLKSWTKERKEATRKRTKRQWKETDTLNSDIVVKKRSKSLKRAWSSSEKRELNKKKNKKYWNQPHIKEKRKIESKELFNDPSYVKKWKKGLSAHPNRCETIIFELLENIFPGEYSFTGGFTFWVDMLNPDFVCKEKRKIIEFFGEYWHKEEDVEIRGNIFDQNGYDSLFIWESELTDIEQIKNKIIEFHER